jgi:lycopene cyclase domain-containing protein
MAVFFLAVGIVFYNHLYTAITFCGAGLWLLLHLRLFPAVYQYRLWFSYLLSLIPFFGVNGVLTALPVVIYNDAENLGIRLGTIPLDDTVYSFLLLMMNLTFYEWLRRRATQQRQPIQATKVSSSA